jgi:hypothetical protein
MAKQAASFLLYHDPAELTSGINTLRLLLFFARANMNYFLGGRVLQ